MKIKWTDNWAIIWKGSNIIGTIERIRHNGMYIVKMDCLSETDQYKMRFCSYKGAVCWIRNLTVRVVV